MLKEWLISRKLYCLVGLGGVHPDESLAARRIGRFFSFGLVLIAIALLFEWESLTHVEDKTKELVVFNWMIWIFFVTQFVTLCVMTRRRGRFLKENWLVPIVIILGIPFIISYFPLIELIQPLRPLLAVALIIPAIGLLTRFFLDGKLMTTILGALLIVVFFGVLVAGVDPKIKTAGDGIWWAMATVTTIGYGDVVPVSFWGRLIGAILVILGLGVFVAITANFLALLLRQEVREVKREEKEVVEILKEIRSIKESQKQMRGELESFMQRFDSPSKAENQKKESGSE